MSENPKLQKFWIFMKIDEFSKKCFVKVPQIRPKSSDFEIFDIWVDSPDSEVSRDITILS